MCVSGAISACEKCARWEEALQLLDSKATSLAGHNAALSALEKAKRWQKALALLRQLPERRFEADDISFLGEGHGFFDESLGFNAVISACGNSGQWEMALSLLQEMHTADVAWPSFQFRPDPRL